MDPLIVVMTVFVGLSAIALCIQAGLLFGIYKATKTIQEQTASVLPQVRSVLTKAEATIDESRKHVVEITAKANEIASKTNELLDLGKAQMVKLDVVVTDASQRAKVQLERAEMVVDDTMTRVHQSVTAVHSGIIKPIREIQAVAAGVSAAVQHFLRGGRPSVAQATHDDEMFI
jgi:ABC-type transporter Mla subunit MlaD